MSEKILEFDGHLDIEDDPGARAFLFLTSSAISTRSMAMDEDEERAPSGRDAKPGCGPVGDALGVQAVPSTARKKIPKAGGVRA